VLIARQPLDDGAGQHQLDHIYLSLNLDGEWTPVDPTGEVAFGWEYDSVYRREEFDV
jgi:hypothetical protein